MNLSGWCAAPEVALPPGCDIEVSAVREGFRLRSTFSNQI